jgi:hypothetical protein
MLANYEEVLEMVENIISRYPRLVNLELNLVYKGKDFIR